MNREHVIALRQSATLAERKLWKLLRDRSLAGVKFRRQHPKDPYIVDFYCAELELAVELDGYSHEGREANDATRTRHLESMGVKVIRFTNAQVLFETEGVWLELERVVQEMREARKSW